MRDVSCKLLSTTYEKNEKGVLMPVETTEKRNTYYRRRRYICK